MFTYYLIKAAWGGNARICARVAFNLMLAGLPNRRSSFTKSALSLLLAVSI